MPDRIEPGVVEIPFSGAVVRGHVWFGDANWVVLAHEPGGDLDAWAETPGLIAREGYSVLAIDLPGHGLSDDPWAPGRVPELVHTLAEFAAGRGAVKIFVIAAAEIATAAVLVQKVDAVVALSPSPFLVPPPGRTPPTLMLVGGSDAAAVARANACFRQTRGWAVVSSFGTAAQGSALFQCDWAAHVLEQTLAFLRDYRSTAAR